MFLGVLDHVLVQMEKEQGLGAIPKKGGDGVYG